MSLDELRESIYKRPRPEDVAQLILDTVELPEDVRAVLDAAARYSYKRMGHRWSSMSTEFGVDRVKLEKQARAAVHLFDLESCRLVTAEDAQALVDELSPRIRRVPGELRRMTKAERRAAGIFKNARWYNKRFRLLVRIEKKIARTVALEKRNRLRVISKTSLASQLDRADLVNPQTVAFVAYMSARMGRRSTFTNSSQSRAFDEVAAALLKVCEEHPAANWYAVAHVMPDARILRRLCDADRARLLAANWSVLEDAADVLRGAWNAMKVDPARMVVSQGDDSSTWNEAAGAWNQARAAWLGLVYAMGAAPISEAFLPGKVMRVMAADVARWHELSGGSVHPDTKVWAALPRPWDVMSGAATCTADDVARACRLAGVDFAGWCAPRSGDRVPEDFAPTPELVHGVSVASPSLAAALRRAGVFSGSGLSGEVPPIEVERDANGFAIGAREVYNDSDSVAQSEQAAR